MIQFRSTNEKSPAINLREAMLAGQALERRGIGQLVGIDLNLRCFCARFGDLGQNLALLRRITFYGVDQIGDEIGSALILILHLAPGGLRRLLLGGDGVDSTTGKHQCDSNEQRRDSGSRRAPELGYPTHPVLLIRRRNTSA